MHRKLTTTLSAAALAMAFSQAALARDYDTGVIITPSIGYYFHKAESNRKDSPYGAVALGYQFDSPWVLELSYLRNETELETSGNNLDLEQLRLDALYRFQPGRNTQPYFLIGGGHQRVTTNQSHDNSLVNVGAGVKVAFNDVVNLRTEVRLINDTDNEMTSYTASIGLQLLLGGRKSPPPPPAPVVVEQVYSDSDGDGVPDEYDQCPGTPPGVEVDEVGCPLDDDGDGVPNYRDRCPDTTPGAVVDEHGCYVKITETKEQTLNVRFGNNSAEIPPSDYGEIRAVADFMRQYPLTDVEIAGHTDDRGPLSLNDRLSQERADAVARILVEFFGIDTDRVNAVGYGPSRPLVDNDTAENRAINRRVTATVSAQVERIKTQ